MLDLRDVIFDRVKDKKVKARIVSEGAGIISGSKAAEEEAIRLGLSIEQMLSEGTIIKKGDEIARFCGHPKEVAIAEDVLIGLMAKPSGIATCTYEAVKAAEGRARVVSGAWKKMPYVLKDIIRRAIITGGGLTSISCDPFVYLDKNYIEMLGGIRKSLEAVENLEGHLKVVQLKGQYKDIVSEACEAVQCGADILFIDTGKPNDVTMVIEKLVQMGLRNKIEIAFGGGIRLEAIHDLMSMGIDILDIGRQIVDAPLLDMRLEIINSNGG